jgi:hypothetical protein
MRLLIIWERVIILECCKYTTDLHDSGQQMCRQEPSTELSCCLRCHPIDYTVQYDVFNVLLLPFNLVLLRPLRLRLFKPLYISPLLQGSLMHYRLDVIYGEWLPGVSELEHLMIEDDLDLYFVLADGTGILRILQKFPDPTLACSSIVLVVESI